MTKAGPDPMSGPASVSVETCRYGCHRAVGTSVFIDQVS